MYKNTVNLYTIFLNHYHRLNTNSGGEKDHQHDEASSRWKMIQDKDMNIQLDNIMMK